VSGQCSLLLDNIVHLPIFFCQIGEATEDSFWTISTN